MSDEIFQAKINPLIKPFLVVQIGFTMIVTIIGIPLAIIWFLGVGRWWARHYYERLECHLSDKTLRYRKGIFIQVEKTIPLENIQDVTFVEGPVLRHFHLSTLKFETAGSSAGQANDMHLTGIVDAQQFRNRILAARDALKQQQRGGPPNADAASDAQTEALRGIERKLDEIISLMRRERA
ncbi:PH domain-containing protein [Massilia glaciei]|nr:PH domain-containing protein [Massilia glaciei]